MKRLRVKATKKHKQLQLQGPRPTESPSRRVALRWDYLSLNDEDDIDSIERSGLSTPRGGGGALSKASAERSPESRHRQDTKKVIQQSTINWQQIHGNDNSRAEHRHVAKLDVSADCIDQNQSRQRLVLDKLPRNYALEERLSPRPNKPPRKSIKLQKQDAEPFSLRMTTTNVQHAILDKLPRNCALEEPQSNKTLRKSPKLYALEERLSPQPNRKSINLQKQDAEPLSLCIAPTNVQHAAVSKLQGRKLLPSLAKLQGRKRSLERSKSVPARHVGTKVNHRRFGCDALTPIPSPARKYGM